MNISSIFLCKYTSKRTAIWTFQTERSQIFCKGQEIFIWGFLAHMASEGATQVFHFSMKLTMHNRQMDIHVLFLYKIIYIKGPFWIHGQWIVDQCGVTIQSKICNPSENVYSKSGRKWPKDCTERKILQGFQLSCFFSYKRICKYSTYM